MTKETKVGLVIGLVFMVGVVWLLQWVTSRTDEGPIAPGERGELAKGEHSWTKNIEDKSLSANKQIGLLGQKTEKTKKTVVVFEQKKEDKTVKAVAPKRLFRGISRDFKTVQDKPPVVKKRFYIVKEGQTLSEVAAAVYGSANGHEWQRIYEANKYKMVSPHIIRPGLKLLIPPLVKNKPRSAESLLRLAGVRRYTVVSGDVLSTISSKKLGTARRWREILALNKDKLSDEFGLREGMVLKLPAKER